MPKPEREPLRLDEMIDRLRFHENYKTAIIKVCDTTRYAQACLADMKTTYGVCYTATDVVSLTGLILAEIAKEEADPPEDAFDPEPEGFPNDDDFTDAPPMVGSKADY